MYTYHFDEHANDVINTAFAEARDLGHRFIGTEHLLLGLSTLGHTKIAETFEYYKVSTEDIRLEIIKLMGRNNVSGPIEDYTTRAKECIDRANDYAKVTTSSEIMPEHLFRSMMSDKSSNGYQILSKLSLDITKIAFELDKGKEKPAIIKAGAAKAFEIKALDFDEHYEEIEEDSILSILGDNLTDRVKDDSTFDILGRDEEISRLIQILSRKTKNNPCLVGEAGVGKTAVVYGLCKRIAEGKVPDLLLNKEIIALDPATLVAGTMFRGQFETRMNDLVKSLKDNPHVILFIDEIHSLVGMGATGEKSMDALGILKPHLTSGDIQLIGTTTYEDFEKYIEPDHAVSRRLIQVEVLEPSIEETKKIINHIKEYYEDHHKVIITEKAVEAAIQLSVRYIQNRKLPDKAIDIVDEACSRKRLESLKTIQIVDELKYRLKIMKGKKEQAILAMDFEDAASIQAEEKHIIDHIQKNDSAKQIYQSNRLYVTQEDIEHVISEWAKVPVKQLSTHEKERLAHIDQFLAERIKGQSRAIDGVSRAIKRSRLGIGNPQKPVGVFLFIGQTGVGKTALAKAIADVYYGSEAAMIRLDMSEYMERHAVSKLIGSPPGYEGNREGGYLTNEVSRHPYSVVVFDEIEKAHQEVTNILLQIMDEGVIKDGKGNRINFKNTLIIMTSNLGVEKLKENIVGFGSESRMGPLALEKLEKAAKAYFKPEFINRIDEIILFDPLSQEAFKAIVKLKLEELKGLLQTNHIDIEYDASLIEYISQYHFNDEYGARPIGRFIDREIKDRIAEQILLADQGPYNFKLKLIENTIEIERI